MRLLLAVILLATATGSKEVCPLKKQWLEGVTWQCRYQCLSGDVLQTMPAGEICPLEIKR